ncbi:MAG: hypothetical protein KAS38_18825 [Anaerolineales bacterium]|nr:hypothetical protein [Anaerolineales bacterium]
MGEKKKMKRKAYERELAKLEFELVKLQEWIQRSRSAKSGSTKASS